MIELLIIIKVLGLSYIISKFTPLRQTINFIGMLIKKRNPTPLNILIFESLEELFTCFKCLSLWVGFIFGGLWIGILSSVLALTIFHYGPKKFFN